MTGRTPGPTTGGHRAHSPARRCHLGGHAIVAHVNSTPEHLRTTVVGAPAREGRARSGRGRTLARVAGVLVGVVLAATSAAPASAVIGGTDATEDYSFMTSVRNEGGHYCGGALVAPQWVVTAAHCSHEPIEEMSVRIGSVELEESNDHEVGGTVRGIAEIVRHPGWAGDGVDWRNDIALLKLDEPVAHAPIPFARESGAPGTPVRTMGWGMTCEDGSECPDLPAVLQELDTEIVPDDRCPDGFAADICSEHPSGAAQACILDSGGPMIQEVGGRWELVGVVSRDGNEQVSMNCVGPGVWADTSEHTGWIRDTAGIEPAPPAAPDCGRAVTSFLSRR